MASEDKIVLGRLLVALYKGVVYRDADEAFWSQLVGRQADIGAHAAVLGLELSLNESDGFAFLRTIPTDGDPDIPRLVPRRQLTYLVSLVLVLLRKKMLEADRGEGGQKLVVGREELVETVRVFLPAGTNDAKITDQIVAAVGKVEELGFLRRLGGNGTWEVRRVLKAFVDAQWLANFDQRLEAYRAVRKSGEAE
jgi:hypothetical protein